MKILLPPKACAGALETIRGARSVLRAWSPEVSPDHFLVTADSRGCHACDAADRAGVVLLTSGGDRDVGLRWLTWSPNPENLRDLLLGLRATGCEALVKKRCNPASPGGITPRQREILLLALERGYFEEPKQVTLAQLANRLQISESVAGRLLRKAVRNGLHLL